ncbi:ABC transporter substrate-binding protein [Dietzia sp. ANT_WB102]|uniref:ABC transporter substrate-binding protein n=1 Tax=Dietzia sp. ANT_WB102 TaxID=2597345 RepID=UPI0011F08FA3|nr:ABC transporter substrate-binding protein [Dietzia sp. ANT_WB102]KAA0919500.1 ABC transporter substrate-binding protein [Dietzia sp. ANT_WB102]
MTTRRDLLRLAFSGGLSLAGLAACGADGRSTTSPTSTSSGPLTPPSPIRTPTPDVPPRRLVALSSADLDVLRVLDLEPTAAWAVDGTGPRPWRDRPAPPSPDWDGPGAPSLKSLLPFGVDAFVMAAADATGPELRAYERLATVIVDAHGRPGWREHLDLVARAVDRDPSSAAERTGSALEQWAGAQRRIGVDALVVVIGTGARPDTPVATLAARSPFGAEIRALGFDVDDRPEPVAYRDLRRPGVQVVRVDPRDGDVVAAVRQPSVSSLPWVLERLVRGRRPA